MMLNVTKPRKTLGLLLRCARAPQFKAMTAINGKLQRRKRLPQYSSDGHADSEESLLILDVDDVGESSNSCKPHQQGTCKELVVPKGFLGVYVGLERRRFVIPMSCLSMPEFRILMDTAAEEFGYEQEGGLHIPCEEKDFEEMLVKCLRMHKIMYSKSSSNKKEEKKKKKSDCKIWVN